MRTIILLVAMACWCVCHAQSKQETAFNEALELFNDQEYEKAAKAFSNFMRVYLRHELKPRAHYNLAYTYRQMENLVKAKETFLEILSEKYNDRDENDLMEPYALYKHHTSRQLAMISIQQNNFDEAEKYIQYFDKKYSYQHFCGNEWAAYDIFKAIMEAKVLEGKKKPDLAVKTLVPHLFSDGLASNEGALEELGAILEKNFNPQEVKEMFTAAFNSLRIETKQGTQVPIITFAGIDLPVSSFAFETEEGNTSDLESNRRLLRTHVLFLKFM
jgi:tetratricopeptide (TPR) repeat protein